MSLNALIINTLNPLGFPVRFLELFKKDGSPDTYITFFEYNQNGNLHADDHEIRSNHYIQVDLFSKEDYTDIVKQVKELLKTVGFTRTFETELFETETEYYHKVIRFIFVQ
ncbi:TPA: hypothetical protein ACG1DY_005037 [Escherichia coli]